MKSSLLRTLAPLAVAVWTVSSASAQKILLSFDGPAAENNLGHAVDGAGDLNGDGNDEVVVGIPGADFTAMDAGAAIVLNGADGSLMWLINGDDIGDGAGTAVAGAGDVDNDTFDDFIAGIPFDDDAGLDAGRVRVYSGATGLVLWELDGEAAGDQFGSAVSGLGDMDKDGFDDFAVGAPGHDTAGDGAGRVIVYSGQLGTALYTLDGDALGDGFGSALNHAGDVDADTFPDLIVGAFGSDANGVNAGRARVYSGQLGTVIWTLDGVLAADLFGLAVDGAGDVNKDGFDDVIVGAPGVGTIGTFSGNATIFSGQTGAALQSYDGDAGGAFFGAAVAGIGDIDGDTYADFAIGAYLDDTAAIDAGLVRVFSGQFGVAVCTMVGQDKRDQFGFALAGAGDIDANGRGDYVIGIRRADSNGNDSGSMIAVAGQGEIGLSYCTPAVPNSTGQPGVIIAMGSDVVADNDFSLRSIDLPIKQFGYYIASQVQGSFPMAGGSQGTLCVSGTIGRFNQDAASSGLGGVIPLDVDLNNMPNPLPSVVMPGDTWNFQCWYRDVNPTTTSNFTDAVEVTFL